MNEVTRMNEAKEWARQLNTLDRDDAWRLLQVHARCRLGTRLERVRWRETSGAQAYFDRAPLAPASFVQRSVRMFAGMLSCADIGRTRADPGRNNRGIGLARDSRANVGWNRSFALSIVRGVEPKVAAFGKKWETQPFKSYPNAKASCSGEHLDLDTVLYSCMSVLYRTVQYEC